MKRQKKVLHYPVGKSPMGRANRQRGVAIMMVISILLFIVLLVQETVFETQVEHRSAVAELNSLQAYYAAKAGVELSLLRVRTYNKLNQVYGDKATAFRPYMDMIWKIPFQWPPLLAEDMLEEGTSENKKSLMKARYQTTLISTGGLIDVNDLASPIRSLRQWTYEMLYRLILNFRKENKDLEDLSEADISRLLNNIKDWVDRDSEISKGPFQVGALPENNLYRTENFLTPFNVPLITTQELHLVKGMTDTLYQLIKPFITISGEKGININTAPYPVLQALSDQLSEEIAQEIAEHTSPIVNPVVFKKETFGEYLEKRNLSSLKNELLREEPLKKASSKEQSNKFPKPKEPTPVATDTRFKKRPHLIFDAPYNFKIISRGFAGRSQRAITVIYVDMYALSRRYNNFSTKDLGLSVGTQNPVAGGDRLKPLIIYWKENY